MDLDKQTVSEIKRMIYYLSEGVEHWKSSPSCPSEHLYKGQMLLMKLSLQYDMTVPNNLFDLYQLLSTPFVNWKIPIITEIFDDYDCFLEDETTLSQAVADFRREYESPDEDELLPIRSILQLCRSYNWDEAYRAVRTFLSQKNHAVLSRARLQFAVMSVTDKKELQQFLQHCYEDLPRDLYNYRICPNCGWTLENKHGEWVCNSHKVCSKVASFSRLKEFPASLQKQAIVRLKPSVQRYVLLPGLQELRILHSLQKYNPVLYPNCDQYDIGVTTANQTIFIDIKDVQNPKLLAALFNEMSYKQLNKYQQENVYIAIPAYLTKHNKAYLQIVKKHLGPQASSLQNRFISERQMKQKINKIGETPFAVQPSSTN